MDNHPRQREMWEGLTRNGCLGIIGLFIIAATIGVLLA